jgi:hypothetical protein
MERHGAMKNKDNKENNSKRKKKPASDNTNRSSSSKTQKPAARPDPLPKVEEVKATIKIAVDKPVVEAKNEKLSTKADHLGTTREAPPRVIVKVKTPGVVELADTRFRGGLVRAYSTAAIIVSEAYESFNSVFFRFYNWCIG